MKRILSLAAIAALSLTVLATGDASAQAQGYGYGYQQAPAGSYQQSCNNLRVRGGMLSANCTNTRGQRVRSSLAYRACNGADIGNINGQLSCVRANSGYYGRGNGPRGKVHHGGRYKDNDKDNDNGSGDGYNNGLPTGSYQQSCNNARMNGSTLSANCRNNSGAMMTSYLDVSQCRSTDDIGNLNGQLRCIYRR